MIDAVDELAAAIERVSVFESVIAKKRVRTIMGRSPAECAGMIGKLPGCWMIEEVHHQPDRYVVRLASFVFA